MYSDKKNILQLVALLIEHVAKLLQKIFHFF